MLACHSNRAVQSNSTHVSVEDVRFDWLLGDWRRSNEKPGRQTYESWSRQNPSLYVSSGYTLVEADTVWQEAIHLIRSGQQWRFEVTGKGESEPTVFTLSEINENSFTCENKQHDFPQKIQYTKIGDKIIAVISGGETQIPFEFEPID